jgi:hypothetical protein
MCGTHRRRRLHLGRQRSVQPPRRRPPASPRRRQSQAPPRARVQRAGVTRGEPAARQRTATLHLCRSHRQRCYCRSGWPSGTRRRARPAAAAVAPAVPSCSARHAAHREGRGAWRGKRREDGSRSVALTHASISRPHSARSLRMLVLAPPACVAAGVSCAQPPRRRRGAAQRRAAAASSDSPSPPPPPPPLDSRRAAWFSELRRGAEPPLRALLDALCPLRGWADLRAVETRASPTHGRCARLVGARSWPKRSRAVTLPLNAHAHACRTQRRVRAARAARGRGAWRVRRRRG